MWLSVWLLSLLDSALSIIYNWHQNFLGYSLKYKEKKPHIYTHWKILQSNSGDLVCTYTPASTYTNTEAGMCTHTHTYTNKHTGGSWFKECTPWHTKENIWPKEATSVCVCEDFGCVCSRKEKKDGHCLYVYELQKQRLFLCAWVPSKPLYLCTDSAELFWQCRSTNTDKFCGRFFAPNNTRKKKKKNLMLGIKVVE